VRGLCQDVSFELSGYGWLEESLIAGFYSADDVEKSEQIFSTELLRIRVRGVLGDKVKLLERRSLFERLVDKFLQVTVVALEVTGRFGNSIGRTNKRK
jgi:hypothetical protein